jgi:polyphosphate kinase 2 (PPK2 family)
LGKALQFLRNHEQHLADNGYLFLKFFLHISKEEQKEKFLQRIDDPDKHWKFNINDIYERNNWDQYKQAYEDMIRETSSSHALFCFFINLIFNELL